MIMCIKGQSLTRIEKGFLMKIIFIQFEGTIRYAFLLYQNRFYIDTF